MPTDINKWLGWNMNKIIKKYKIKIEEKKKYPPHNRNIEPHKNCSRSVFCNKTYLLICKEKCTKYTKKKNISYTHLISKQKNKTKQNLNFVAFKYLVFPVCVKVTLVLLMWKNSVPKKIEYFFFGLSLFLPLNQLVKCGEVGMGEISTLSQRGLKKLEKREKVLVEIS